MNKITRIRLTFLAIFLTTGITLSLVYASTAHILNDNALDLTGNQLPEIASHTKINNKPNNSNLNSQQLSEVSSSDYLNNPIVLPNGPTSADINVISRGIVNRNTYDKRNKMQKSVKPSIVSPDSVQANKEINKMELSESSQEEVKKIAVPESTQEETKKIAVPENAQEHTDLQYKGDLDLLARLINAEAQGEPYEAKVAVGAVVINRVQSGVWADTIKEVIYQNINGYYQFTPVVNGWIDKPAQPECIQAAEAAMNGSDPTGGAQFYYDDKTTNAWILSKPVSVQIGHMIYAY